MKAKDLNYTTCKKNCNKIMINAFNYFLNEKKSHKWGFWTTLGYKSGHARVNSKTIIKESVTS